MDRRRSRDGLARLVLDVMCRNSAGEGVVEFIVAESVGAEWEASERRGDEGALRFEESWERVAMVDDSRREVDGGEKVEVYYTLRTLRNSRFLVDSEMPDYQHRLPYLTTYHLRSPPFFRPFTRR